MVEVRQETGDHRTRLIDEAVIRQPSPQRSVYRRGFPLALGVVMCLVAVAAGQEPDAPKPDELERTQRLSVEVAELYRAGRFSEGIPKARELLILRETTLGANHLVVGATVTILARLLEGTGDAAAARPLFERAWRPSSSWRSTLIRS